MSQRFRCGQCGARGTADFAGTVVCPDCGRHLVEGAVRRLVYVTGVSCAGKTTTGRAMKQADPSLWVTDIDTGGTPNAAHLDWLHWRAAEALHAATERDAPVSVVTGIVWPHAVIDSNAWPAAMKSPLMVDWVLLDPPWKLLRERLGERLAAKPRAERRDIIAYNRGLRRVLRRQVEQQRLGHVVRYSGDVAQAAKYAALAAGL